MAHSAAWLGATQGALLINRAIVHDTGPRVQILIVAILHKRDTYSKSDINNNKSKICNNACLLTDGLHDDRPEAAVSLPPVYPHVAILPPAGAPGVLQLPVVHSIAAVL